MSTEANQGVAIAEVLEATVRISNDGDESRVNDIEASAHITGGRCDSVTSGTVTSRGESPARLAEFRTYSPAGPDLGVSFSTATGRPEIMEQIEAFVNAAAGLTI